MENTLALLMKDKTLRWYTVAQGKPRGPLSAAEIVENLKSGELSFASPLWKEGFSGWTRLYDVIDFRSLLPPEPSTALIAEIQKTTQSAPPPLSPQQQEDLRKWYVQLEGEQNYVGPISDAEVVGHLQAGRVTARTYMWRKGMKDWELAGSIPQWAPHVPKSSAPADKRSAPRKPFEAKILLTDGKEVGEAVCRDISVGGMQLLTDQAAPGPVGTQLRLNVAPGGSVTSFTCEGEVIRVLEDGRGFSFRFTHLPADARAAIEKFIAG